MSEPLYTVGDKVQRANGSYRFPGEVRGVFTNRAGRVLYNVEHLTEVGLIHVFREGDLKPLTDDTYWRGEVATTDQ